MKQNEQADRMRRHLDRLCDAPAAGEVDFGGWPTRLLAVSAAIGMAAALGACYGTPPGQMLPPDSPDFAGDLSDLTEGLPPDPAP